MEIHTCSNVKRGGGYKYSTINIEDQYRRFLIVALHVLHSSDTTHGSHSLHSHTKQHPLPRRTSRPRAHAKPKPSPAHPGNVGAGGPRFFEVRNDHARPLKTPIPCTLHAITVQTGDSPGRACGGHLNDALPNACTPTPVRYAVYPWTATVTQGSTASIEGVSTGNARSPAEFTQAVGPWFQG